MKILLPVDGSDDALEAVRHAIRLVEAGLEADFVLTNVQAPAYLFEVLLADADAVGRATGATAASAMESSLTLFDQANLRYRVEPASGEPVPVLLGLIDRLECDAVIMGTRGLGVLRAAMLGSVSQGLVQEANVPVTLVKSATNPAAGHGDPP